MIGRTNPDVTVANSAIALSGSFPGDLGIELLEIDDDAVTGRLLVDRRHLHPGGYVHGGVWVAFADTVAAWGTMRNLPPGHNFTTAELKEFGALEGVKVIVNPLVDLIWLAGVVFLFGSFVALWPDAREERRLVRHELAVAKLVTA